MKEKKILFTAPGAVETVSREIELPEQLARGEYLLKTEYTLISPGTELDCLLGRAGGAAYPKCLGYSAVARVLKRGPETEEFAEGDRVLVYHSSHREYLFKSGEDLVRVPEGLDPVEAVFAVVGCMGFQGIRKTRLELGESCLVTGLGLLGQIAVQCASLSGAFPLIVMDYNPFRRELALAHGADAAFSPDEPDLIGKVKRLTRKGLGVNCAAEITGNPEALKQVLKLTAPFGRVTLTGCSRTPTKEIDFYNDVHRPGIELIGGHNMARPKTESRPGWWTMRDDMALLMDLIRAGKLNTRALLTEVAVPEDAPEIYPRFIRREEKILGVVFDWTRS